MEGWWGIPFKKELFFPSVASLCLLSSEQFRSIFICLLQVMVNLDNHRLSPNSLLAKKVYSLEVPEEWLF